MPRVGKRGVRGYQSAAAIKRNREQAALEGRPVTAAELQPDGIVRNGGARPGAGRPPGVPWDAIQKRVEKTGASFEEILALPIIPERCLEDPAIIGRIRDVVERAQLVFRLNLREAIADKGLKAQSVTALLGIARNTSGLEWDQQSVQGSSAPDVAGLEVKIDELLERLAKKARASADHGAIAVSSDQTAADIERKRA